MGRAHLGEHVVLLLLLLCGALSLRHGEGRQRVTQSGLDEQPRNGRKSRDTRDRQKPARHVPRAPVSSYEARWRRSFPQLLSLSPPSSLCAMSSAALRSAVQQVRRPPRRACTGPRCSLRHSLADPPSRVRPDSPRPLPRHRPSRSVLPSSSPLKSKMYVPVGSASGLALIGRIR